MLDSVDDETVSSDDSTLANVKYLYGGLEIILGDADQVDVFAALAYHLLLFKSLMHGGDSVAQNCRALVVARLGGESHFGLHSLYDLVALAAEERHKFANMFVVVAGADRADAGAAALLDVIEQARPAESFVLGEL